MPLIVGAYSQLSPGTPLPLLERALTDAYKPLLTYIYKHPELHIHVYIPGSILEWFEQNHPEMNMLIADLVKKEQVELTTGPYQQPVLQVVPGKDRSSQLESTTTFIRKRFGKRARTAWFYNQIWNPSFVSTMGMGMLDRLLISSYDRLHGIQVATEPFVMQDLGKTIEVFPFDDRIDALVESLGNATCGFKEFAETLLKMTFDESDMYKTVMINLDRLLQGCALNQGLPPPIDLIIMILDRLAKVPDSDTVLLSSIPTGIISTRGYLGSAWYGRDSSVLDLGSYNDMFIKYEELNHLYGRLLYLIDLAKLYRKNKDTKKRVESLLVKATSGGALVLDPSGGCYRNAYRKYVYRYLNDAEKILAATEEIPYPRELDLDFDGHNELIWMGRNIGVVVDAKGGTLAEINYLPTGWNYGDTFTGYAAESDRLSFPSIRDGSFQRSFNDVFLPHDGRIEFYAKHIGRQTFDAGSHIYDLSIVDRSQNEIQTRCIFENLPFGLGSLELTKRYRFRTHTVVVDFSIHNIGKHRSRGLFGSELNLSIGIKDQKELTLYTVEKSRNRNLAEGRVVAPNLKNFRIPDDVNKTLISFASDNRFTLYKDDFRVKLATVMGMEVLYEYTQVLPLWDFDLQPEESLEWTIGFRIERRLRVSTANKEQS
ncbi:MAG TPA: hypothetical protein DHV69_02780 [Sphaerochaeta sp.]|nr:MAG: hypothetical protein CVV48_06690 [Spirochaetae bacterium HGW-Spirochaetae-4]HCG62268.1 hypothetical protein [Sphaerochaeta sp.]HCJ94158.1 hypothetical protein [Sphaerochaeta sp.]HCS36799.1 hypothetical protein [Sphaerochaeta sp.]